MSALSASTAARMWPASSRRFDNWTSSARTRELLGWKPAHPDLITDLAEGHYFAAAR